MAQVYWQVKVYFNGEEWRVERFDSRGKAAAYAMRWNKGSDLRWKAEVIRREA